MKNFIILSPSKEMDWSPGTGRVSLSPTAEKIVHELCKMDKASLATFFAIKDDLAEKLVDGYAKIEENRAKAAMDTYTGLAFRQMDKNLLARDFAGEHLVILSALYGPLSPHDMIRPYRLDFTKPLKVEEESLKSLQKKNFTEFFAGSRVFDLASGEFSSRIDKKQVGQWINIDFCEGDKKAPSATAKKLRGLLANHILREESFERKVFESFHGEGFSLSEEGDEEHLIFRKH